MNTHAGPDLPVWYEGIVGHFLLSCAAYHSIITLSATHRITPEHALLRYIALVGATRALLEKEKS